MDKLITLVTQQGLAQVRASTIDGFIRGNKKGSGYVLIRGVGTPLIELFERSEKEFQEWFQETTVVGKSERPFEFRDLEDNPLTVRLGDVRFIRRHNQHAVVFLVDNISIRSCEDYYDLRGRFNDAMK